MKTKKTKKKKVPVNELYAAIKNGMGYEEAAEHAMAAIKDELGGVVCWDTDPWRICGDMEGIIALLVEKNDHSIRFEAEKGQDYDFDWGWYVRCRPYIPAAARSPWTELFLWYQAEDDQNGTSLAAAEAKAAAAAAATLSQFVLDFYGIKNHVVRKLTKKEAKDQIKEIKREIKVKKEEIKREILSKTKEIKDLTCKMNRLAR